MKKALVSTLILTVGFVAYAKVPEDPQALRITGRELSLAHLFDTQKDLPSNGSIRLKSVLLAKVFGLGTVAAFCAANCINCGSRALNSDTGFLERVGVGSWSVAALFLAAEMSNFCFRGVQDLFQGT